MVLCPIRCTLDLGCHYARESHGFKLSAASGGLFANVKAKSADDFDVAVDEGDVKIFHESTVKDDSLLMLDVKIGKTVLEMKERISKQWGCAVEDMTLMDGDVE